MPVPDRTLPASMVAQLANMFTRMDARGLLESVQVYGRITQTDANGVAIARPKQLLGTIRAFVGVGGGSSGRFQEGPRSSDTHTIYFPDDGSGILTEENVTDRWVILANRDNKERRFNWLQSAGLYFYGGLAQGSTTPAPNVG